MPLPARSADGRARRIVSHDLWRPPRASCAVHGPRAGGREQVANGPRTWRHSPRRRSLARARRGAGPFAPSPNTRDRGKRPGMRLPIRALALTLLAAALLPAQDRLHDHNLHGWYSYFGDHPIAGSRWGVHVEGQFRRREVVAKWQQLLIRTGVNYQASKSVLLTAGYAFVRSDTHEPRLGEQAWIRSRTGKVGWSTRLRFENRFLETGNGFRYENRFRAWQQIRVPITPGKYVTAYDEFWVYVKPYVSNSWFDQNRAYAAVGFELSPTLRLETGYMNQAVLARDGKRLDLNHTIMLSLFSTAPLFGRR